MEKSRSLKCESKRRMGLLGPGSDCPFTLQSLTTTPAPGPPGPRQQGGGLVEQGDVRGGDRRGRLALTETVVAVGVAEVGVTVCPSEGVVEVVEVGSPPALRYEPSKSCGLPRALQHDEPSSTTVRTEAPSRVQLSNLPRARSYALVVINVWTGGHERLTAGGPVAHGRATT
ncbi:unnamed protein product [Gadus morhua 'NCC']